jgi:hypothetical protein
MEHNASAKNKTESSAATAHLETQSYVPGVSLLPLLFCIAVIPLTDELNRSDHGYQVH